MVIEGKKIAEKIIGELKRKVQTLKVKPHLAVILVGQDPTWAIYVKQKEKKGKEIGAKVTLHQLPEFIDHQQLVAVIEKLNQNPQVHGIIIQRPLPPQIDKQELALAVDPQKDVDGFHPRSKFPMPVAAAVMRILEEIHRTMAGGASGPSTRAQAEGGPPSSARSPAEGGGGQRMGVTSDRTRQKQGLFTQWLTSKNIVVIGKGETAGSPIILALEKLGVTPQVIDSRTQNPELITNNADIIISCVGKPEVVKPELIKKGLILIGVGLHRDPQGKLTGDYDEGKTKDIASFYTPTPGGTGPVNVACLLENLVKAAKILVDKKSFHLLK